MKHNKAALYALCALAVLGAAAAILLSGADIARAVLCYPLKAMGMALRSLSLAGGALNAVSIAVYAAVSLLPSVFAVIFARRRGCVRADGILYMLTVVLFAALYISVNPGILRSILPSELLGTPAAYDIALGALNSLIYSLVLCFWVLRAASRLSSGGTDKLLAAGAWLLYALCAVLAFALAYGAASAVAASLKSARLLDICVCILRAAVDALPGVFGILLALSGARLLLTMRGGPFCDAAVSTAQRLSRLAIIGLKASVISCAAFNAVQIALAGGLSSVNVSANIPLTGVLFALLALIFSRLIAESKRIKDDNDSII